MCIFKTSPVISHISEILQQCRTLSYPFFFKFSKNKHKPRGSHCSFDNKRLKHHIYMRIQILPCFDFVSDQSLPLLASGHLLGLSHDDSKFCEERFGVNSDKRLMSSILTSIDASKPWSRCTSATITDFFDDGNGECGRKPFCPLSGTTSVPFGVMKDLSPSQLSAEVFFTPSPGCICVFDMAARVNETYLLDRHKQFCKRL